MTPSEHLERAAKIFGSKRALADQFNLTAMAVTKWGQSQVPLERAIKIEQLTGGQVRAAQLRPDVFGEAG